MNVPESKVNPISALTWKLADLNARKREMEQRHREEMQALDTEISDVRHAMDIVSAAIQPYQCTACHGTGEKRVPDAAGQTETRPCPVCKGTGINPDAAIPDTMAHGETKE